VTSMPSNQCFRSILWPDTGSVANRDDVAEPDCFHDLNLDQVLSAITEAWPEEDLAPFFRTPLRTVEAVTWRHAVFRDLTRQALRRTVRAFIEGMREVRARLAWVNQLYYLHEKERAHLGAAAAYTSALNAMMAGLEEHLPASPGLREAKRWLETYIASPAFMDLSRDSRSCLAGLKTVDYTLLIRSGSVTIQPFENEGDASVDVEEAFSKFRRDAVKDYRIRTKGRIGIKGLNHIEAQILEKIARLHPQPFAQLDKFCERHEDFIDPIVARFAREACFYLAWLDYTDPMRQAGLAFCYPSVDVASKTIETEDAFDVALAAQSTTQKQTVVRNDFALHDNERILVVSGPNHGGKTTFARMFGQLHWLAALGCTVPGKRAKLFLFDRLFTHFEREESVGTLRGKLQDDLFRIHHILERATPRSLIVLNEIFASTTLEDALWLGRRIMARMVRLDALAVCVTFLAELAAFDRHTVSMVAEVDPNDPTIRTFKVRRRAADDLAYAVAIANKHRVTREWLLKRIAP
jgi:DNA mismatch repair protein MutS